MKNEKKQQQKATTKQKKSKESICKLKVAFFTVNSPH